MGRILAVVLAVMALGCEGSPPTCEGGDVFCDGRSVAFSEAGETATFAVCGDAWEARCDDTAISYGPAALCRLPGMPPYPDGAAATCSAERGAPRCITIPCDGTTYYGADHPDAP